MQDKVLKRGKRVSLSYERPLPKPKIIVTKIEPRCNRASIVFDSSAGEIRREFKIRKIKPTSCDDSFLRESEEMQRKAKEGYAASADGYFKYRSGLSLEDNPYPSTDRLHSHWQSGWQSGWDEDNDYDDDDD